MTKTIKIRQNELSIEQMNAIDLLVTGKCDREVAEAVGVTRQTVNEWRNHDYTFKQELQRHRVSLWDGETDRLVGLVPLAIDVLADDLKSEDKNLRRQAAIHILKACGLYGGITAPEKPMQDLMDDRLHEMMGA